MFGWLKRRFGIAPTAERVSEDVFTAVICGEKRRFDPLEAWRNLEKAGGIYWADMLTPISTKITLLNDPKNPNPALEEADRSQIENIHKARQIAIETLSSWVRQAFALKNFDQQGPSDTACMDLLGELLLFVNQMASVYRPFLIFRKRDAPSPSTQPDAPKD